MLRSVGDTEIQVHYDGEGVVAWATNSDGDLLNTVLAYAGPWREFFPTTEIYRADK